jgi:hypothetical protein
MSAPTDTHLTDKFKMRTIRDVLAFLEAHKRWMAERAAQADTKLHTAMAKQASGGHFEKISDTPEHLRDRHRRIDGAREETHSIASHVSGALKATRLFSKDFISDINLVDPEGYTALRRILTKEIYEEVLTNDRQPVDTSYTYRPWPEVDSDQEERRCVQLTVYVYAAEL